MDRPSRSRRSSPSRDLRPAEQRLADNKRFAARHTKIPSLLQGLTACAGCGYAYYLLSVVAPADVAMPSGTGDGQIYPTHDGMIIELRSGIYATRLLAYTPDVAAFIDRTRDHRARRRGTGSLRHRRGLRLLLPSTTPQPPGGSMIKEGYRLKTDGETAMTGEPAECRQAW